MLGKKTMLWSKYIHIQWDTREVSLLYHVVAARESKIFYYKLLLRGLSFIPDPPPGWDFRKLRLRTVHSKKVSEDFVIRKTYKRKFNADDWDKNNICSTHKTEDWFQLHPPNPAFKITLIREEPWAELTEFNDFKCYLNVIKCPFR